GTELPASADFAFSGQRIVTGGNPLDEDKVRAQVLAGLFYDLRHVFRFPAIKSGPYWKDLGIERFYDQGSIDRSTVAVALTGDTPIRTRWRDLTDDVGAVRNA